jgi:hexosaminidase
VFGHLVFLLSAQGLAAPPAAPLLVPAPASVSVGVRTFAYDASVGPHIAYVKGEPESYTLSINERGIFIDAADAAGAFYAAQTLAQLPRPLPEITIHDAPRFKWRGLHLDVARHFFSAADVMRLLELMSHWKLNVFHWHLTDDQGWRLPVSRHPELTSTGPAYSEDEIRQVVAFAAERHITVVPEIDLPGHTRAILAVHPELSCRGEKLPLPQTYGIFEDVLCIGNPATYALVDDVLASVESLFPGPYLHLGGDEVPTKRWHACPRCRDLHQADFLKKVLAHVHKQAIGWDEVLEQDAPKDMIVMRWRNTDPVKGHPYVLNPFALTYFSEPWIRWQDVASMRVPDDALGVQAALWTEDLRTFEELEPLLFPRLLALADVAWAKKPPPLGPRLAAMRPKLEVAYDIEPPSGLEPQRAFIDAGTITLTRPEMFPDAEIRYSLDATAPSLVYAGPIAISATTDLTAQVVVDGRAGRSVHGHYVVAPPLQPVACEPPRYKYFENTTLVREGSLTTLIPADVREHWWSIRVTGTFEAKETGVYRFDLRSDDGSQLFIGGRMLIDNWGDHAPRTKSGEIALERGCHALRLDMYQHGGGYTLSLDVSHGAEKPRPVFP